MLKLKNIKKDYIIGDEKTHALRGIDLEFRENEFVSILGQSGCGKTTMLNIIGGLDQYTSGDLLIEGKSTKQYIDSDWDAYRNAEVGFVFQSYNLISHLSVLDNVAIALSLSGVKSSERLLRAKEALNEVGLQKQIHKKPNQLSGGQMQRVAIARALINNPRIVLADEPTGALDSNTSVQIMEILKEISKNRLVIMVTHNGELANRYSSRIVEMLDGEIIKDTNPLNEDVKQESAAEKLKNKKTKMSFMTAVSSSFKNLLTKKSRTIITSIAGSIGIIGIALVLSVSSGMTSYVNVMQSDTLAGFPITINQTTTTSRFERGMSFGNTSSDGEEYPDDNIFYAYDKNANTEVHYNNINADYISYINNMDSTLFNSISYTRSVAKNVVVKTSENSYKLAQTTSNGGNAFSSSSNFAEIPNSQEFIETQYDILAGEYPISANQLALIVDKNNAIDTTVLSTFGININDSYTVNDLLGTTFKVVANDDYYVETSGIYVAGNNYSEMYNDEDSISISISAIMRVKESSSTEFLSTGIGYTTALTDLILSSNATSKIVQAQIDSPTINVLTGMAFTSSTTYGTVMKLIGGDSMPSGVQIYPKTFDAKEAIKKYLDDYNTGKSAEDKIIYSDMAATISSSISSIISTITVILSAFAAISLVVSSVMIGIITYVSVVERTKEIGIMRAVGARKKDISRIFNAEALLIGLAAGLVGVLFTYLLCIPATLIVSSFVGSTFTVVLPIQSAILLILLSMLLTFIAGLFPSKIAAKKNPVIALRTE